MRDAEPYNSDLLDHLHPDNLFVIRKAWQAIVQVSWEIPILLNDEKNSYSTNNFL